MSNLYPEYNTRLFNDIYSTVEDFYSAYTASGFPNTISQTNLNTLFYLLTAKYGNNPIANLSESQFKIKLFSIIWQYGPNWEKKLEVQTKLRALSDADLQKGATIISNHAYNPSTEPGVDASEVLDYINEQSSNINKRSALDGYNLLVSLLRDDITANFLKQFQILFKKMVAPELTLLFESGE